MIRTIERVIIAGAMFSLLTMHGCSPARASYEDNDRAILEKLDRIIQLIEAHSPPPNPITMLINNAVKKDSDGKVR